MGNGNEDARKIPSFLQIFQLYQTWMKFRRTTHWLT